MLLLHLHDPDSEYLLKFGVSDTLLASPFVIRQPRLKGWRNRLHLLMRRIVKSHCKGYQYKERGETRPSMQSIDRGYFRPFHSQGEPRASQFAGSCAEVGLAKWSRLGLPILFINKVCKFFINFNWSLDPFASRFSPINLMVFYLKVISKRLLSHLYLLIPILFP